MRPNPAFWVYLHSTPLLGLGGTLVAWAVAVRIAAAARGHVAAQPMVIAFALIAGTLLATGTPYGVYFNGAQYIHVLLGPATVALAVPMHANRHRIATAARAIGPALVAGSVTASASAMLIARALGGTRLVIASLGPKSVTTPIAMGIAERIGGQPSLAAAFVVLTGIVGILTCGPVARLCGVRDWRAQGLAAGTAAHGLATARMLLLNDTAGAFGGLAIGLNGIVSAAVVPPLARWLVGS